MESALPAGGGKPDFANRVVRFAKRAVGYPRFPLFELIAFAVAALAAISGPFHTSAMPWPARTAFWALLMAWNVVKWRIWFAWRVRREGDWRRASLIGGVLLNLLLPLEVETALLLVGIEARIAHWPIWLEALGITVIVYAVVAAVRRALRPTPAATPEPGALSRAGARPERIAAVKAEDHYCRLYEADGSSRLVLCRFGDALVELAAHPGERIHRSAWVADWAVERAVRDGRAWRLAAAGELFSVSPAFVAAARGRGWLNRR